MLISWKNQIVDIGSMVASQHSCLWEGLLATSSQRPNSILRFILWLFVLHLNSCQSKKSCRITYCWTALWNSKLYQSKFCSFAAKIQLFLSNLTLTSLVYKFFLFFPLLRSHFSERISFLLKMDLWSSFHLLVVGKVFVCLFLLNLVPQIQPAYFSC